MLPFVEVIAPYALTKRHGDFLYAPPQGLHLFHEGSFVGPFVYPYTFKFDLEKFQRTYRVDRSKPQPIRFLCRGGPYTLLGPGQGRLPPRLPTAGWHDVPARDGPARTRPVLAHHLRRTRLAYGRA